MIKRYTRDSEYSYTLGIAPTIELLKHQLGQVQELIVSTKALESDQVSKVLQTCRENNIPVEFDDRALSRLTNQENTYVAGVFNKYAVELKQGNFVVLANPSDTGNLGTIIRTMIGFGYENLAIIEPAVDIWDPKVIRASMGAIFSINCHLFPTFEDFQKTVKNASYLITKEGATEIKALKPKTPFNLVFGSEGSGLPEEYLKFGEAVKIAQTENIDSLNLAIAVGVALYELK